MVAESRVVINALRLGRLASNSADLASVTSPLPLKILKYSYGIPQVIAISL
jgi:hypothetical protein